MLSLLVLLCGQTIDYKVLKSDVVNSQNYNFTSKFVSKIVPQFTKKPVYLVEFKNNEAKETLVGEVVCLHHGSDKWLLAKANLNVSVPKDYVMRANFKITEASLTSGCNYIVENGEVVRFIIVSPLFASTFK